jgi:hypothetical protein
MLDNYSISGVTKSSQRIVNSDPKLPVVSTNSVNGTPDNYQTELSQLPIIRKMRWFFVSVIVIWIFAAISITAVVFCITRNPFSFSIYTCAGYIDHLFANRHLQHDKTSLLLAEKREMRVQSTRFALPSCSGNPSIIKKEKFMLCLMSSSPSNT